MNEGNPEHFFPLDTLTAVSNGQEGAAELEMPALEGTEYDIQRLRAEGYDVDDDNEPAPENTPTEAATGDHATYGEWGFSGIRQRRTEQLGCEAARLRSVMSEIVMSGLDILTMFIMFLPKAF
jgi:hypothetical protein